MEIGAGSFEEIYTKSKLAQETAFDGILALEKSGVIKRLNESSEVITFKTIFASLNWLIFRSKKQLNFYLGFIKETR